MRDARPERGKLGMGWMCMVTMTKATYKRNGLFELMVSEGYAHDD